VYGNICVDEWSKKTLSKSYLGISACFYNERSNSATHVVLNVKDIDHPHTGDMLANVIQQCLDEWRIKDEQVVMIVTDNGSNLVKAIKVMNDTVMLVNEDEPMEVEVSD